MLITAILNANPQYAEEYEIRSSQMEVLKSQNEKLLFIIELLNSFKVRLDEISVIRKKIKGLGILNYIFGISPNLSIERHLIQGSKVIQEAYPLLMEWSKQKFDSEVKNLFINVANFLQELNVKFNKKNWSFSHIDLMEKEAKNKINGYLEETIQLENKSEIQEKNLVKEMDNWLDQF